MANNVVELTYGELSSVLSAEISANPGMEHEKAIILIGTKSSSISSYVKGIELMDGEKILQGTYYRNKPV